MCRERVKPALFLNKLDRLFLELNKDPEEVCSFFGFFCFFSFLLCCACFWLFF